MENDRARPCGGGGQGSYGKSPLNRHLRRTVLWPGLILTLACLFGQVRGCSSVEWSSDGSGGGGEPGTNYFVLTRPYLQFQASPLGFKPELGTCGSGPCGVSLDQFEMNSGDLKGWAGDFVAVKHADGRVAEIAIYYQGVVCRRYTFDYGAAGRARRRVDTEYELRRKGESAVDWATRLRGQTPAVACVREIEYAWSEEGRTVEVTLRTVQGKAQGYEPISLPDTPWREPGQRLETWQLNGQGLITSVLRDGRVMYAAKYDDAGRLLGYEAYGREQVENLYDAQRRLVETRVKYACGTRGVIVHAYPGGPRVDLPQLKEPGDAAWVVTHDKGGRVSRIREHSGPASDILANTLEEFQRDKDGRIIWRRVALAR